MSTGPFPQPHYPGFPPPHAPPVGRRRGVRPLVAAVFAVLAAAALVVGTLLPSLRVRFFSDGTLEQTMTISAWRRELDPAPTGSLAEFYAASHVALYGIPLSVIAAALLAGAVATVLSSRRGGAAGRVALIAAAAAAVAAVAMLAMDVDSSLSFEGAEGSQDSLTTYDIGLGGWIIGGGGVLALLAGLLALGRSSRSPDDDPTPPQGFISPVASGYGQPVQGYPPPPAQSYPQPGYGPPPQRDAPHKGSLSGEEPSESRPWPPEPPVQRD